MATKYCEIKKQVMENPSVHTLAKEVIKMAEGKDCVDAYYDVKLALYVIKARMDNALGR